MPRRILATLLLPLLTTPAWAQNYPPAVTYESLMGLRFYPATGGFLVDGLWIVFPPDGDTPAEFIVRRPDGKVVATMPLRIMRTDNAAFARLESSGPPLIVSEAGNYVIAVRVNQQEVTALPFTMRVETSGDPFNPGKAWYRDGLWNRTGFLSVRSDDADKLVSVNLWTSLQEIPSANGQRQNVTVNIKRGATEIANGQSVIDWNTWQPIRVGLRETRTGNPPLKLSALTDGAYTVEYRVQGRAVRAYPLRVQGGQIVRPPRNQLGASPATEFVSPRVIGRIGNEDVMQEVYWLEVTP